MAQYQLGCLYGEGDGIQQNFPEALKWFESAADQGDIYSIFVIGRGYYEGDKLVGGKKNHAKALEYMEEFINGFRGPDGMIIVTEKNDESLVASALRMLQALYRFGRGTAVDVERANALLQEATLFGDPDAAAVARVLSGVYRR